MGKAVVVWLFSWHVEWEVDLLREMQTRVLLIYWEVIPQGRRRHFQDVLGAVTSSTRPLTPTTRYTIPTWSVRKPSSIGSRLPLGLRTAWPGGLGKNSQFYLLHQLNTSNLPVLNDLILSAFYYYDFL